MCKLLKLQVLTPRLEFVMHVLEQAVLLSCDLSRLVLAADPVSLVLQLVAGLGMEPVSVSFSEKHFQNTICPICPF